MLKVERLTKSFGSLVAVDNVSFSVPTGQMVGIIGRSGAGKSTLLRMINRLTDASSGRMLCDDVFDERSRRLHAQGTPGARVARALRDGVPAVQPGAAAGGDDQRADGPHQLSLDAARRCS